MILIVCLSWLLHTLIKQVSLEGNILAGLAIQLELCENQLDSIVLTFVLPS